MAKFLISLAIMVMMATVTAKMRNRQHEKVNLLSAMADPTERERCLNYTTNGVEQKWFTVPLDHEDPNSDTWENVSTRLRQYCRHRL